MGDIENHRRGNGVASPTWRRRLEADSEDEELDALQAELDVRLLEVRAAEPLPATRGAITRLVKRRMPVPGGIETKQPSADNLHEPRTPVGKTKRPIDDNLHEPRTPVGNPHDAMSGGAPPSKRNRRGSKWGTPSGKTLNMSRKCVVSRAYKAAVAAAMNNGANAEDAARAGRAAFKVASETYIKAMCGAS